MDTDSTLISALARDLDGSFEALVLAHQDRLYSIALRLLGDPRDAEEAAQDAFVRAYRALAALRPRADPRAAASAVAGDDRAQPVPLAAGDGEPPGRRSRVRPCRSTRPSWAPSSRAPTTPSEPAATAVRRDARETWAALLMTLPPAYRSAVVLRHVDGLSYPEVATALDRPEGTVKAQVHRGLALLRTAFEAAQQREREEMTA